MYNNIVVFVPKYWNVGGKYKDICASFHVNKAIVVFVLRYSTTVYKYDCLSPLLPRPFSSFS